MVVSYQHFRTTYQSHLLKGQAVLLIDPGRWDR